MADKDNLFLGFGVLFGDIRIGIIVHDEGKKILGSNVREVSIHIGEQVGLFSDKENFLSLAFGPADKRSTLTPLTNAGHIADDEHLALLHLMNGKTHGIHLLGRKALVLCLTAEHFVQRLVAQFIHDKLRNILPFLCFQPFNGITHGVRRTGRNYGTEGMCAFRVR